MSVSWDTSTGQHKRIVFLKQKQIRSRVLRTPLGNEPRPVRPLTTDQHSHTHTATVVTVCLESSWLRMSLSRARGMDRCSWSWQDGRWEKVGRHCKGEGWGGVTAPGSLGMLTTTVAIMLA